MSLHNVLFRHAAKLSRLVQTRADGAGAEWQNCTTRQTGGRDEHVQVQWRESRHAGGNICRLILVVVGSERRVCRINTELDIHIYLLHGNVLKKER